MCTIPALFDDTVQCQWDFLLKDFHILILNFYWKKHQYFLKYEKCVYLQLFHWFQVVQLQELKQPIFWLQYFQFYMVDNLTLQKSCLPYTDLKLNIKAQSMFFRFYLKKESMRVLPASGGGEVSPVREKIGVQIIVPLNYVQWLVCKHQHYQHSRTTSKLSLMYDRCSFQLPASVQVSLAAVHCSCFHYS